MSACMGRRKRGKVKDGRGRKENLSPLRHSLSKKKGEEGEEKNLRGGGKRPLPEGKSHLFHFRRGGKKVSKEGEKKILVLISHKHIHEEGKEGKKKKKRKEKKRALGCSSISGRKEGREEGRTRSTRKGERRKKKGRKRHSCWEKKGTGLGKGRVRATGSAFRIPGEGRGGRGKENRGLFLSRPEKKKKGTLKKEGGFSLAVLTKEKEEPG